METVDAEWAEEQMAAAEAEIEQQKKEWEMERLAIEQADEKSKRLEDEIEDDDVLLTYASEDAKNQVNDNSDSKITKRKRKKGSRLLLRKHKSMNTKSSSRLEKNKKLANPKFKNKLRQRFKSSLPSESHSSTSISEGNNLEIKSKLKVEAVRLEHLHLLNDNTPDSNLIAKSLAKMKRKKNL